jgi:hypothetical protein
MSFVNDILNPWGSMRIDISRPADYSAVRIEVPQLP